MLMIRVQKIELFYVEIPLENPLQPAWYRGYKKEVQRMNILRLTTEHGVVGHSAGWAIGPHRIGLKEWLPKALLGVDVLDMDTVLQRLRELSWWGWDNIWIEPAFWDIHAKIAGVPVYQLLADNDDVVDAVNVYCSTVECPDLDERLRRLEAIQEAGFDAIKLCLTGDFLLDLPLVRDIREQGGSDLMMMLDACQGRRTWVGQDTAPIWKLSHALDFAVSVEPFRIEWLEEPLDMYAYGDLSVLRSESTIPIAGGRMNKGWQEFKVLLEHGSYDFYQPDATIAGGVTGAAQLLDACIRRDLHFSPNAGGSGISMLINLHLFASWPKPFYFEFPFEPGRWTPNQRDAILKRPLECKSGLLEVPQEPGFGIELDEEVLAKYGTCWLNVECD
jgi:L-alanine-DL-glutamate epimerase-like enolase superfamily enzyme